MENTRRWRWGVNRWLVLLFIILGAVAASFYAPILPHIQLPAEAVFHIGGFAVTNTIVAMLLADIIILAIAWTVRNAATSGKLIPTGLAGAVEAMLEAIYNLTESTAGRWASQIFPWFASITLYVLIVNWMELIPGVDSIGLIEHAEAGGHEVARLLGGSVVTLAPGKGGFTLVPFVRVLSTDLNFTVALAVLVIFMTQVFGVRALGPGYFTKFFNVKTVFTRPIFGVIDFAVGILEIISEFSRILSFAFRLFGNIFAGSVLLFVIGSLVPVFAQSIFLLLEFFVGLIQALIFGLLGMVFMSMATQGHGDHEEQHEGVEMPIEGPEMI